jgi:hypothetical protein
LLGPTQAIACKVAIVGGGRHDAYLFTSRQKRSRASMHFNLCDLPAFQAAVICLHRKAGRFRQRGNILHGATADIASGRRSLLATAVHSPSTLLGALSHDAGVHVPAAKAEQNGTVRVRTCRTALIGDGEATRSAVAAFNIPTDQRRPVSSKTTRTITTIPRMPTPP